MAIFKIGCTSSNFIVSSSYSTEIDLFLMSKTWDWPYHGSCRWLPDCQILAGLAGRRGIDLTMAHVVIPRSTQLGDVVAGSWRLRRRRFGPAAREHGGDWGWFRGVKRRRARRRCAGRRGAVPKSSRRGCGSAKIGGWRAGSARQMYREEGRR